MARKRRRLHKRYGKKRSSSGGSDLLRSNPPLLQEIGEFVLPGFAGFAAARFLTRIASTQIEAKKPSWGKHAGAIASIASFAAAWWGANRVKFLEKYHTPLVVGAALAGLQSIIQLYIPKLGWMISDATPQLAELAAPQVQNQLPDGVEYLDEDPNLYSYNDSFDNGRSSATPVSKTQSEEELISDLNLDDGVDLNLGSLG